MIKKIFTAVTVSAFIFSCNNAGDKTNSKKENRVIVNENQEKNKDLIYLDTAENIYNILCQVWVMEDDAGSLEGMTESSQMEIPYRSLCFSANGTFFKNPRNSFDYGTWQYDDATKTITINNSIEKGKDVYKIAKIAYDEMTLVNTGIGSITNLKFIAPGKRYKNASDEPYSLQNNRWRIKPTSKESDSAIHQRLKENL